MAQSSILLFNLNRLFRRHFPTPLNQSLFSRFVTTNRNTKVNFSPSDSESDDNSPTTAVKEVDDKSKLPPPYDPFKKTPVIHEPDDPTNLQEVFHKIRTQGLNNNAVKMFDALSKDGLTHEALDLFSQIKDKGEMPDVVAHTAVIEAYAAAGKAKEALKVYMRMLASGVLPNAYTYTVLIKSLAESGDEKLLAESKKYFMEMMGKGIRPNPGTCVAVFEGIVKGGKEEEGRQLVMKMKALGFAPDHKGLRELLNNKRGQVFRSVINILFGN
ncbi:pentatricopeptide repeat-containing protein At4g38150-like [Cynara cardunculus var. scolymus]|uniref:Pentatricopeptide repeat-containing protein n=1 Tax=Cynara cardunculus var. scolymus TaxID=59895 RepID=A0A103YL97_CYNCS|nr:pentatricopeptide repeat-containing protein At4g38150-like [Cynara cardunculus var. scolymus]KVI11159.1 Pentatricopeptide repeat-containing protein [Cynara cardunculus var. scolymus]